MITGHCIDCLGTGMSKYYDMIGTSRVKPCPHCNGLGGKIMKEGSGEHRISANIGSMKKGTDALEEKDGEKGF